MYRISIIILAFTGTLFHSCSTDVELTADWKQTTIIYGLLNQYDNVQYVKVYKTFLDPILKPADMAQVFDSLYYSQVEVKMEEMVNGVITSTRILVEDESIPKDPGVFSYPRQVLYKDSLPLDQDATYRISINVPGANGENETSVTAETPIVKDFKITSPSKGIQLSFASTSPYKIKWTSAENGKIYKLVVLVHYTYSDIITTLKSFPAPLEWLIFDRLKSRNDNGGDGMTFELFRENFFHFINGSLNTDNNVIRTVDSLSFMFSVGSEVLSKYIDVQQAQTGLVQTQIVPEFTNIENGIGLFASRYTKVVKGIKLNISSIDSLACGSITGHLNFRTSPGSPNYPFCD